MQVCFWRLHGSWSYLSMHAWLAQMLAPNFVAAIEPRPAEIRAAARHPAEAVPSSRFATATPITAGVEVMATSTDGPELGGRGK